MKIAELSKEQIERQNFVDNQIFELTKKLIPNNKEIVWNIDLIGNIRDVVQEQLIDICSAQEFYPYLSE